jgi:hypothetical protein
MKIEIEVDSIRITTPEEKKQIKQAIKEYKKKLREIKVVPIESGRKWYEPIG